jgi:DNA-binding MarR family transcriptional regulator
MVRELRVVDDKVAAVPASKQSLRLWLRLYACTNMIEQRLRLFLKEKFDTTLPRFDFMAMLYRADGALSMGELSRLLLVSNGNVTGVAERLEKEGLITRRPAPHDRRTQMVSMTPAGRAAFESWAAENEKWIASVFAELSAEEMDDFMGLLIKAKESVIAHDEKEKGEK